jgi:Mrp family chromosome partitioning ATPase
LLANFPLYRGWFKRRHQRLLPNQNLIQFYQAIESMIRTNQARIIGLASAKKAEGCSRIGFELAQVASQALGQKVLLIDRRDFINRKYGAALDINGQPSLLSIATQNLGVEKAVQNIEINQSRFHFATLFDQDQLDLIPAKHSELTSMMSVLRQKYSLIIIVMGNIMDNSQVLPIGRHTDGLALVVEAERTRMPVVLQAINQINQAGGHLLGLAMNKSRFYIPRWLYRQL